MRNVASVLLLGLAVVSAHAGTGIAKYAGEFMALGVGGRALGLGGAYVALANDVTAGYWNPAGLSQLTYPQAALMHAEQFGSLINYDYGAVAFPFRSDATLALSVIRLGVDNIPDTRNAGVDQFGNPTSDPTQFSRIDPSRVTYFNAADWALYCSYASKESDHFSYGANLKLIRRDVGEFSATGIGFDVGVWYAPFDELILGANIQDVTTTFLAWDTGTNELVSPTMKIGTAYFVEAWGGRFAPALDLDLRFEGRDYAAAANIGPVSMDFHAGLEYQFRNVIALRAGYNDVKQWSFGAGIHLPKLDIDYSFGMYASGAADNLDDTHRISLMFTLESEQFKRSSR